MGFISSLFGGQKPAAPPPPPPPPVLTPPVVEDAGLKAEQDADAMRRRRGSAANILSQGTSMGTTGAPMTGAKTLTGQ